jgi:hypothetical protein
MEANSDPFAINFESDSDHNEYSQVALFDSHPQSPLTELEKSLPSIRIFDSNRKVGWQDDEVNHLINPNWLEELQRELRSSIDQGKNQENESGIVQRPVPPKIITIDECDSTVNDPAPKIGHRADAMKDESTSTANDVNTLDSTPNEANEQRPLKSNNAIRQFPKSIRKFDVSPKISKQTQQKLLVIELDDEDDESIQIFTQNQNAWDPSTRSYRLTVIPQKSGKKICRKQKTNRHN